MIFPTNNILVTNANNKYFQKNISVTKAPFWHFLHFSHLRNTKKEWEVGVLAICICIWVTRTHMGLRSRWYKLNCICNVYALLYLYFCTYAWTQFLNFYSTPNVIFKHPNFLFQNGREMCKGRRQ